MKEQILLFHFEDSTRLAALKKAVLPLHIACKEVEESAWDLPIGSLVGLDAAVQEADAADEISGEMLVLCGLGDGQMQQVLMALRKAGLVIPCKAVLTPYNKDWTAKALFAELCREHEKMCAAQKMKNNT